MFTKCYKILGISKEMYSQWKSEFDDRIIVFERPQKDDIEARIYLNPLEALIMKIRMNMNNKKQPYYRLALVPD
jgi:hypothetical protein|nr:MAG TPA: protein of Unknown Function (DUF746) [Caudoviricetes sp.]